jgi:hypothetical protein
MPTKRDDGYAAAETVLQDSKAVEVPFAQISQY